MEQVFTAPTVEEANRKADQWLAQRKDVRVVGRAQTSARWGSSALVEGAEWTVRITMNTFTKKS